MTALAFCSVVPFILRRPAVYEVEITSGYAFMMLALYLLASGCAPADRLATRARKPVLGARLRGETGAHAGRGAGGIARLRRRHAELSEPACQAGSALRRDHLRPDRCPAVLGPLVQLRRFRIAVPIRLPDALGGTDVRSLHLFSFAYMSPSLTYMLINPIYFTFSFPFVGFTSGALPVTLPQGYSSKRWLACWCQHRSSSSAGGFPSSRGTRNSAESGAVLFAIAAFGLLGMLLVAYSIWGVTQECDVDYVSLLLIPALLGVVRSCPRRTDGVGMYSRLPVSRATLYASFVGFAISFTGYYGMLQENNPGTYWTLERATSFIPTAITAIAGHPDIVRVYYPEEIGAYQPTLTDVRVRVSAAARRRRVTGQLVAAAAEVRADAGFGTTNRPDLELREQGPPRERQQTLGCGRCPPRRWAGPDQAFRAVRPGGDDRPCHLRQGEVIRHCRFPTACRVGLG